MIVVVVLVAILHERTSVKTELAMIKKSFLNENVEWMNEIVEKERETVIIIIFYVILCDAVRWDGMCIKPVSK